MTKDERYLANRATDEDPTVYIVYSRQVKGLLEREGYKLLRTEQNHMSHKFVRYIFQREEGIVEAAKQHGKTAYY